MLQQTLIAVVIPAFERVIKSFPTLEKFAAATEDDLRREFRGLGYYRRFNLMHKAAKQLCAQPNWQWPQNRSEWRNLPGIGEYTSAALASITNNEACGVVDGNVERVLCRLHDWREPTGTPSLKKKCQTIVDAAVCRSRPGDFNQALMQIGQLICTPLHPRCSECPLAASCRSRELGSWKMAPAPKSRPSPTNVSLKIEIVSNQQGEILLVKRSDQAKFLKSAWGFPTWSDDQKRWDGWQKDTIQTTRQIPVGTVKHSITTNRITVSVSESKYVHVDKTVASRWARLEELDELLVSNLDRKALRALIKSLGRGTVSSKARDMKEVSDDA